MTIIGFQDGFTIAYQAELIIEDDNIFMKHIFLINIHVLVMDVKVANLKENGFGEKLEVVSVLTEVVVYVIIQWQMRVASLRS